VTTVAVRGHSYKHPGETRVVLSTDKWADAWIKVVHPPFKTEYDHFKFRQWSERESWGSEESNSFDIPWWCGSPMLKETHIVRVRGEKNGEVEDGEGLVATGHFVDQVSKKWCKAAKARERHH
jgi:hypothetical protein